MFETHFYRRNLPHIYIPERTYFITFRLKDSLPYKKIYELRSSADFKSVPKNKTEKYEKDKKFFAKYDELLNKGNYGKCYLKNGKIAEIVVSTINYLKEKDYNLIAYCIMPNHVHLVLNLKQNSRSVDKIMQSIKRYSAREINRLLKRSGSLWQAESYDHVVRDEDELYRIIEYVLNNPVKAGLVKDWKDWKHTFVSEEYY
jgi:REP element-mobilizing transposase RayT